MKPSPDLQPSSAVFDRANQLVPQVTQPTSPWTMVLGLVGAGILGVITFASLSASREARAQTQRPVQSAPPVPSATPAFAPPAPPPAVAPATMPTAPPQPAPAAVVIPENDPARRLRAPALVVDLAETTLGSASGSPAAKAGSDPVEPNATAEERFAARVGAGGVETARATRLRDLSRVAPQGTLIPAVLETAINSDLPGAARAVVSQDVRGFDGAQVLIPRGSKLFGQYRSGVAYAQTRAFVIWSRILTPEGVSIEIGSPSTDPLGRGGLEGQTDTHFRERFGGAILLSVLNTAVAAASPQGPSTAISIGGADAASRFAPQAQNIPVTIKVKQGTPLQVLLTRDLDFTTVAPRP